MENRNSNCVARPQAWLASAKGASLAFLCHLFRGNMHSGVHGKILTFRVANEQHEHAFTRA